MMSIRGVGGDEFAWFPGGMINMIDTITTEVDWWAAERSRNRRRFLLARAHVFSLVE